MPYGSAQRADSNHPGFVSPVDDACRNHFSILGLLSAVRNLFSSDSDLCPETVLFPDIFSYIIIMTDNFENGNFCTEIIFSPTSGAKAAFLQSSMLHRSAEASTLLLSSHPAIRFHTKILFRPY